MNLSCDVTIDTTGIPVVIANADDERDGAMQAAMVMLERLNRARIRVDVQPGQVWTFSVAEIKEWMA
jgi:hypothetical protein